jgi:hypothetical protein
VGSRSVIYYPFSLFIHILSWSGRAFRHSPGTTAHTKIPYSRAAIPAPFIILLRAS